MGMVNADDKGGMVIRLKIFADGEVFTVGESRKEAQEIFEAYYTAVKGKKRSFDLIEYQKEK
jgi:hypothetical protein